MPDPGATAASQGYHEIRGSRRRDAGTVKKAIITPVRDRWAFKSKGGPDLGVQGSILDQEYRIGEGRQKVGKVSKKWFRLCDTHGVEVAEGQDDALILAVTVAIDRMAYPTR